MNLLKGSLILIRPDLSIAAGICVVTGQMLALGTIGTPLQTIAGFFSVAFISGAILGINDCFDVVSDTVNAPHRPIPSGMINKTWAIVLSISLLAAGLLISLLINATSFAAALLLAIVGFLYNWKFKQTGLPGNLMVSFSVGMTFVYGGITVGLPFEKTVLFFGLLSAMLDLGEEIAADTMDVKGDREINSRSLAIRFGRTTALMISCLIFVFVVLLTFIPFIIGWFKIIYIIPFIFMDTIIILSVIKLLKSTGDEGRSHIKWIYRSSTTAILVFLVMRLLQV